MAPTRTVKNKHAANGSGIRNSKSAKNPQTDSVIKAKKNQPNKSHIAATGLKGRPKISEILKKRKQRVYSAKELGIPELNKITPVGVEKPKGKKKGKTFVDDRESMTTILALVTAEKEGQIESKMIKARQMEEIREARRVEAEAKDQERKAKFDETKDQVRKKRKREKGVRDDDVNGFKSAMEEGTRAMKPKGKKKKVSFAAE
ncbi:hypothetical protein B0H67DRAFT_483563 [Lasiosphaeris hirsuta]|uniref:60S ribosomal subunit assembly/export protein LOC1 n=1 Tax=Lasiosphaeris hirsuta TaxID=260670 RepID=A0AA40DXF7_9PEZI|nr:hypothetical protein B0H67DRAFT_483563 [Lasiosphaeris hirsuta]